MRSAPPPGSPVAKDEEAGRRIRAATCLKIQQENPEYPPPPTRPRVVSRRAILLAYGFWALSATDPPIWNPFGPFETREECDFVRLGLMRSGTASQADSCEPDETLEQERFRNALPGEV